VLGPFDAIHVGAAAPQLPQALVDQLAKPGRMFIPIGGLRGGQAIYQIDKDSGGVVTKKELFGVSVAYSFDLFFSTMITF
jgi:protein-L-isoaspartate(D-aspartate) O-methyltransferase